MTQLEHIVAVANKKYFGNRLRNVKIRYRRAGLPKKCMARTRSVYGPVPKGTRKFLIEVDWALRKYSDVRTMTVLHELVHVEQWDEVSPARCHGRKFQNRMKDLASKGAFNGLW